MNTSNLENIKVSLEKEESISAKILRLYDSYPWLFDALTPEVSPEDYILQLNRKTGTSFMRYSCPSLYSAIHILETYKDNFIFTTVIQTHQNVAYTHFFGIAPDVLLIMSGGYNKEDDFLLTVQVHTNNPKNFFDFLKKHTKDEYKEKNNY